MLASFYANSFTTKKMTNVFATTPPTSCYTPEVPYAGNDGYSGESSCNGACHYRPRLLLKSLRWCEARGVSLL